MTNPFTLDWSTIALEDDDQNVVAILRAVREIVENGKFISPITLREVNHFDPGLCKLLQQYDRALARDIGYGFDRLRQLVIERIQRRIDVSALSASQKEPSPPVHVHREISPRKLVANRCNASKSTGPRTAMGKRAVRLNAWRHGALSEVLAGPGENEEQVKSVLTSLRRLLEPDGRAQDELILNAAVLICRLLRCIRAENSLSAAEVSKRGSTLLRYERSLNRQLRELIGEVSALQVSRED